MLKQRQAKFYKVSLTSHSPVVKKVTREWWPLLSQTASARIKQDNTLCIYSSLVLKTGPLNYKSSQGFLNLNRITQVFTYLLDCTINPAILYKYQLKLKTKNKATFAHKSKDNF